MNRTLLIFALTIVCLSNLTFAQLRTTDCGATLEAWVDDIHLDCRWESNSSVLCGSGTSQYRCKCISSNQSPVCTPVTGSSSSPSAAGIPVTGYRNSEDFAIQMMGNLFANLLQGVFKDLAAPIKDLYTSPHKDISYQNEIEKKKQENMDAKYKEFRGKEEQRTEEDEERKKQKGKDLLAKMEDMGRGNSLEPFKWETSDLKLRPIGKGIYDTSGYTSWQRALCAAYFSSKALDAVRNGDPEGAVFMNKQADGVITGEMIELECQLPALQEIADIQRQTPQISNRMADIVKIAPDVCKKVQHLQVIETELNKAEKEKQTLEKKLEEVKVTVEEAKTRTENAKNQEEKDQADKLLQQALTLQKEISVQFEKVSKAEENYLQMKEREIEELKNLQKNIKSASKNE